MRHAGLVSPAVVLPCGDGRWGVPMLVKCPKCRAVSRIHVAVGDPPVTNFFCPTCQKIVLMDLLRDEVKSTSSADTVEKIEHRKKILVADGNARVRAFAAGLLRAANCDVLEAEDGPQAVCLINAKRPDLILLMSEVVSEKEVLGT
ncbi:MAG: hypothetical protein LN417_05545, partial [Candidatus Thermoplasmatota archaeon]|nr:hypothetical protein [Candidatus Thermoplasmatota archaeon]